MGVSSRRDRLEQLLNLAQTYRGWTRRQLAKELGRDTTKLVPDSGLPKLDLLMDLARVLDWPVEDVAGHVWLVDGGGTEQTQEPDFEARQLESRQKHRAGEYADAVRLARESYDAAVSPEERAIACNREASGLEGLGRYKAALEAARKGLRESDVTVERRLILQSNLANAYYSLWHLIEARGISQFLIEWFDEHTPTNRISRVVRSHALYVRGHTYRRLMTHQKERSQECAHIALSDLERARDLFHKLADDYDDDSYRGVAHTCEGGLLEVDAMLGRRDPRETVEEFVKQLSSLSDANQYPAGDWLESYGWWCILGCNVALYHLQDERQLQKCMAVFTSKADEIAKRLDNWSLRERVLTMEFARRQRFADWTGVHSDWTIDKDDVRAIAGTMGRFPTFHRTGWQILESAKLVANN